ncbi:MAG: DUF2752 domain-containing protein [Pyrinomonadaceae bacterium]
MEAPEYSNSERISAGIGLGVFSTGCLAVGLLNPSESGLFPGCPFLQMTGFACPGCGLTRGFHALFHGDVIGALDYNALIPFFALGFVYLLVLLFFISVLGKSPRLKPVNGATLTVFMICAGIFAVLRNLPFEPFSVLFP